MKRRSVRQYVYIAAVAAIAILVAVGLATEDTALAAVGILAALITPAIRGRAPAPPAPPAPAPEPPEREYQGRHRAQ